MIEISLQELLDEIEKGFYSYPEFRISYKVFMNYDLSEESFTEDFNKNVNCGYKILESIKKQTIECVENYIKKKIKESIKIKVKE